MLPLRLCLFFFCLFSLFVLFLRFIKWAELASQQASGNLFSLAPVLG